MTTLHSIDPRTARTFGAGVPATTREEVDAVCRAAQAAAESYAGTHPHTRAALMRRLATALRAESERIIDMADAETALGRTRLAGELERTCGQFELYGDAVLEGSWLDVIIDEAVPDAVPPRPDLRRMNIPLGPVAVYAASNFPLAFSVAGTDTAAALAAGCPVVAKAHSSQPGTAKLVGDIVSATLAEAGADPGLFAVVYGFDAGVVLITNPAIKAGAFTGSQSGGRALFDAANSRPDPIPFYGELGSLNPVVVTAEAIAARGAAIAEGFAGSATMGSGQFCTKPGLLLLPEGHGLADRLATAMHAANVHPMLHERIRDAYVADAARLADFDGVRTLVSPRSADGDGFAVAPGLFEVAASRLTELGTPLREECFGPTALIGVYRSAAELSEVLASLPGALAGAIHLDAPTDAVAEQAMNRMSATCGRVIVNGWPTGVAVTHAMHHGGPWPATTVSLHTSVGTAAARRFLRPVCFQATPAELLPEPLRDDNPLGVPRRVNGALVPAPQ